MQFSSDVLSYLVSVSIRALGLAALSLAVVWLWRIRSAAARHAMGTALVAGMLALAALSPLLPTLPLRILHPATPAADLRFLSVEVLPPGAAVVTGAPIPTRLEPRFTWQQIVAAVYALGVLAFFVRLSFGYLFTRRLLKASRAIHVPWPNDVRESAWISVPMTVGCLRARILLPSGWQQWTAAKLEAVMAHERTHIQRGDWAVAVLAGLNRCIFWFHPLAWWLERKLAFLAEQACDDAALLEVGTAPYAQALLDMASAVKAGQGRLVWEAMAMANVAEVKHRIERILDETRQIPKALTPARWAALILCSLPLIYLVSAVQLAPAEAQQVVTQPPRKSSSAPSPAVEALRGRTLAPGDVALLEQHLLANPHDLDARSQLILYYYDHGIREPRLSHIFWLIANHPESTQAVFASRGILPRATNLNDASDYARAAGLWKQQAASRPNDPHVLANAAEFLSQPGGDIDEAERLLKAARDMNRLARLYTTAIVGSAGDPRFPDSFPAFANRVKTELESSNDASFLSIVGRMLAGVALRPQPGQKLPDGVLNLDEHPMLTPVVELGNRLLSRTGPFGGVNPFPTQIRPATAPATAEPAPPPPPAPSPITKIDPIYPPLARQARIQGDVRFSAIIGPDGHVQKLEVISGHPLMVPAAIEAVKQWVFPQSSTPGPFLIMVPFRLDGGDAPLAPPPAPSRVRIGSAVQAAKLVNKVDPVYPQQARAAGVEGDVQLDIVIAEDGHVESAQVVDGHPLLATAAIEAVRQWTYKPTFLNGNPVTVLTTVTVSFK